MRLVFSECTPNYQNYVFPYQVQGYLEDGDTPGKAFELGMLPSSYDFSRFYLARSVRVDTSRFRETRRTRYANRQCADIACRPLDPEDLVLDDEWCEIATRYYRERHQSDFSRRRCEGRLSAVGVNKVLAFVDVRRDRPVGFALVYREGDLGYCWSSLYDPDYLADGIGGHIATEVIRWMKAEDCRFAYLGTCYSKRALYKTRFEGVEFFDGSGWNGTRADLHLHLDIQDKLENVHLREHGAYLTRPQGHEVQLAAGLQI